jgi:cellulose synthase (UDP-forming)
MTLTRDTSDHTRYAPAPFPAYPSGASEVAAPSHPRGHEPSPVMILVVLISTIGILAYTAFLLNPANRGDFLPYTMVIVAESVLVFHALLAMWTILSGGQNPRDFAYHRIQDNMFVKVPGAPPREWEIQMDGMPVTVDIFITVYGEDIATIRRTATAARDIHGRHFTWILDDGKSDEVSELAAELGVRYVRRLSSGGAKAGNVNHALTLAKGEFFAVFDADFVPEPQFLEETLPFFHDPALAFVQTPQSYGNLHTTVARGAAYMQAVFYRFIQPGRNRFNAAFCVGTNVIFRRTAIDDVGGIYTDSKSEDVWTSLMLHEKGWRSIFIPTVLATGDAPETIEAYSKQQLRWATGGFEILLTHHPFGRKRSLTMDQRIQYLVTATFYLTGICPLLLLLVPPLEIYFDLRPMNLTITVFTWALYYTGFYLMQILLAWYTLGSFRWQTLTLATVSFPIYAKALYNVLVGRDVGWQATGTAKGNSPFNFIVPQVLFFTFLMLTSVVAVWRDWDNQVLTLATAWNITNTVILGAFVLAARREAREMKRPSRRRNRNAPPPVSESPRTTIARPEPQPEFATVHRATQPATPRPRWSPVEAPAIKGGRS